MTALTYRGTSVKLNPDEEAWLRGIKKQYEAGEIPKVEYENQARVFLDAKVLLGATMLPPEQAEQAPAEQLALGEGGGMVESPPQGDTSLLAAEAISSVAGKLRLEVLRLIAASPNGLTDEEGIAASGMPSSTYRPRRVELSIGYKDIPGGWIEDSGRRRDTIAGKPAKVWVATEKGRAAL